MMENTEINAIENEKSRIKISIHKIMSNHLFIYELRTLPGMYLS
jgi:hypothetical protein